MPHTVYIRQDETLAKQSYIQWKKTKLQKCKGIFLNNVSIMHKNHLYTWAFTLIDIYSSSTLQVNVALFDSCLTILCCNVTSLPSPGSIMFMAQCLLLRFCVFFLLFDTLASFLLQNPSDILYPSSSHSSCQFSSNRWFIFTRVHTQFTFSLSQLPP